MDLAMADRGESQVVIAIMDEADASGGVDPHSELRIGLAGTGGRRAAE